VTTSIPVSCQRNLPASSPYLPLLIESDTEALAFSPNDLGHPTPEDAARINDSLTTGPAIHSPLEQILWHRVAQRYLLYRSH